MKRVSKLLNWLTRMLPAKLSYKAKYRPELHYLRGKPSGHALSLSASRKNGRGKP